MNETGRPLRVERDSMGEVRVPADALYGATRYEEALAAYRAYFAVDKFPDVDALLQAMVAVGALVGVTGSPWQPGTFSARSRCPITAGSGPAASARSSP